MNKYKIPISPKIRVVYNIFEEILFIFIDTDSMQIVNSETNIVPQKNKQANGFTAEFILIFPNILMFNSFKIKYAIKIKRVIQ